MLTSNKGGIQPAVIYILLGAILVGGISGIASYFMTRTILPLALLILLAVLVFFNLPRIITMTRDLFKSW